MDGSPTREDQPLCRRARPDHLPDSRSDHQACRVREGGRQCADLPVHRHRAGNSHAQERDPFDPPGRHRPSASGRLHPQGEGRRTRTADHRTPGRVSGVLRGPAATGQPVVAPVTRREGRAHRGRVQAVSPGRRRRRARPGSDSSAYATPHRNNPPCSGRRGPAHRETDQRPQDSGDGRSVLTPRTARTFRLRWTSCKLGSKLAS